ncbi:hypothetical protein SELMODRAFT_420660 [Selaginella moellendorffii]|uniref:Uncharacterized protein n=1 Tax=Selaginella moellendorffii TaxID=88036 RepID=D8SCQ2_SELML|nr:hypothetical protein SELMODRAFT_420660 [Selaginella moellendorffii]
MGALVTNEAFRLRFVSESNVGVLYDALEVVLKESTFTRIASLLQSSGWGKWRMIASCIGRMFGSSTVPCNLGQVAKAAEEAINQETFVQSLYMGNETGICSVRILGMYPTLLDQLNVFYEPEESREENFYSWETEAQTIMQEAVCHLPQKAGLRLLLVFDEARELLGSGIDNNISLPLRRATAALQPDDDRLALEAFSLASPSWGCFCADIGVKQWAEVCQAHGLDAGILSEHYPLQYGRPLWWAVFRGALAKRLTPMRKVINMARNKLLGGVSAWNTYEHLTTAAALAVLGARCAIDFDPTCSLTSKLVAAHLMTVVKVEPNREQIWVGTAMEPVLAQAAAQVMRKLDEDKRNVELYSHLQEVRGASGEESSCTVDKFIEHLVGKSLTEFAKYRSGKQQAMQVQELRSLDTDQLKEFARGKLTCTSFHKIHKPSFKVDAQDIRECLERRCAIICYDGTWGVDFFLPWLLEDAQVSPQYGGVQISDALPFLSLYMNVGDIMGAEAVLVDPYDVEAALRKNMKTKAVSLAIAAKDKEQVEEEFSETEESAEPDEVQLEARMRRLHLDSLEQRQEVAWLNMERDNQVILKVAGLGAFAGVLGEDLLRLFHAIHKIDKVPMLDKHNKLEKIQGPSLQSMFPVANILKD